MSALLRIGIGGEPLKEFYDAVHDLLVRIFLAETTHRDDLVIAAQCGQVLGATVSDLDG
jgi:hypothetical protein